MLLVLGAVHGLDVTSWHFGCAGHLVVANEAGLSLHLVEQRVAAKYHSVH